MCKFDGNWNIACNDYELWSTEELLITLKKVLYYTNTWHIYFVMNYSTFEIFYYDNTFVWERCSIEYVI